MCVCVCADLCFAVVPQFECAAGSRQLRQTVLQCQRTHLSRVPVKMYFPFGENLTNETGGFSSSNRREREGGMDGWMEERKGNNLEIVHEAATHQLVSSGIVQRQCPKYD